jgi:hypothetical protein
MDFRRSRRVVLDGRGHRINPAATLGNKTSGSKVEVTLLTPRFSTRAGVAGITRLITYACSRHSSTHDSSTQLYNQTPSYLVGSVAYLAILSVVSLASRSPELGKMRMAPRLAFPAPKLPAAGTNSPDAAPKFLLGGVLALWFQCEYK